MVGPVNSSWVSASSAVAVLARSATGSGAPEGVQPCWTTYPFLPILLPILNPALRAIPAPRFFPGFLTSWLLGPAFLSIFFWPCFQTPFSFVLVATWLQLGLQLGPKIHPKSLQEPSKIHPKSHLVFHALLDWFLVDFWSNLDSKITPKCTQNSVQRLPNKLTTEIAKCIKNL